VGKGNWDGRYSIIITTDEGALKRCGGLYNEHTDMFMGYRQIEGGYIHAHIHTHTYTHMHMHRSRERETEKERRERDAHTHTHTVSSI
jgi:hypothetical protein